MGKLRKLLKRIRLVYKPSTTMTKTVVISAIAVSLVALVILNIAIKAKEKKLEEERNQAFQQEQINQDLQDKQEGLGSAEGIDDIAKDDGMVDGDAVIITPQP